MMHWEGITSTVNEPEIILSHLGLSWLKIPSARTLRQTLMFLNYFIWRCSSACFCFLRCILMKYVELLNILENTCIHKSIRFIKIVAHVHECHILHMSHITQFY